MDFLAHGVIGETGLGTKAKHRRRDGQLLLLGCALMNPSKSHLPNAELFRTRPAWSTGAGVVKSPIRKSNTCGPRPRESSRSHARAHRRNGRWHWTCARTIVVAEIYKTSHRRRRGSWRRLSRPWCRCTPTRARTPRRRTSDLGRPSRSNRRARGPSSRSAASATAAITCPLSPHGLPRQAAAGFPRCRESCAGRRWTAGLGGGQARQHLSRISPPRLLRRTLKKYGIVKDNRTGYSIGLSAIRPTGASGTMSICEPGDRTELKSQHDLPLHDRPCGWSDWGLEITESDPGSPIPACRDALLQRTARARGQGPDHEDLACATIADQRHRRLRGRWPAARAS